jgi:hypothetical protein
MYLWRVEYRAKSLSTLGTVAAMDETAATKKADEFPHQLRQPGQTGRHEDRYRTRMKAAHAVSATTSRAGRPTGRLWGSQVLLEQ